MNQEILMQKLRQGNGRPTEFEKGDKMSEHVQGADGRSKQTPVAAVPANGHSEPSGKNSPIVIGNLEATAPKQYALSALRWPLLLAVVIFGFCNGFANEHPVILNVYVESLDMDLADYINLYQAFFFVPFVGSFLAANLVDNCGLKMTIYVALLMACVRNGARMLLFMPNLVGWNQLRLIYWLIMRALTQMNSAFYTCFPLKLSESWFPDTERSFAWSLLNSAPILGIATGSMLVPRLVKTMDSCHWIAWYNGAGLILSVMAIGYGVRSSEPAEGPPSLRNELTKEHKLAEASGKKVDNSSGTGQVDEFESANPEKRPSALLLFGRQVARVIKDSNLLIQMLVVGTFGQLMSVIVMVLQDIFKGAGLSSVFTGQFLAFQIFASVLAEVFVARRLKPKGTESDPFNTRICKLLVLGMLITFVLFAMSLVVHELPMFEAHANWFEHYQWLLVTVCTLSFEVARNCARPFFTEQTAELICGVVSEANSSAFRLAISSIVFNVSAFTFVRLRQMNSPNPHPPDQGAVDGLDLLDEITKSATAATIRSRPLYLRPILFVCCVAFVSSLIYWIKFNPDAKRRRGQIRHSKQSEDALEKHRANEMTRL